MGLGKLVGLEQVLQKGLCLNTTKEVGEGKGTQWGLVLASRGILSGVKTTTTSTGNRSLLSPPQLPHVLPVLTAHVLILLPSMPCRSWQIPTKPLRSSSKFPSLRSLPIPPAGGGSRSLPMSRQPSESGLWRQRRPGSATPAV